MDLEEQKEEGKRAKLRETNQAGKKNLGSEAYNPLSLEYHPTEAGMKLKARDDQAKHRAMLRSQNIDSKGNSTYNILTGALRVGVAVPPGGPVAKPEVKKG